ncbi:MAG: DnaJ domain-containing protein [Rhodospirillales bacterium]|nr:DnaJ domain-containing protein [Rhodospirillales bacterium]MDE2200495.1 DnaJ domain-containing protein [Rhodospirillales bacterium]MDE2574507.1 DnaJ domain-containing protein [Rhodospirillales bacterium]
MADDPYKTLGVARDATDKQIRTAFLKLAKTSHPDLNPGDARAEERFKAINAAHDLLGDPERRARFDRGEIDAAGQERPQPGPHFYRDHAEGPAGAHYRPDFAAGDFAADSGEDLGDILAGLFRAGGGHPRAGGDRHYSLAVPFLDAVRGTTQRLVLPDGASLEVRIPAGLQSGQVLRLRGKGAPSHHPGQPPGDALIEVTILPHPIFRREGRDIHLDLPISIAEAVLGARVSVPTIEGKVSMAIPPGAETGTRLRLRGRGVPAAGAHPAGDAFATLRIMRGPNDPGLAAFLAGRTDAPQWNPRAGLEEAS